MFFYKLPKPPSEMWAILCLYSLHKINKKMKNENNKK